MFLKLFLNSLCFVAGCINLLKEARAIMVYIMLYMVSNTA